MGRGSGTQLQVGENLNHLIKRSRAGVNSIIVTKTVQHEKQNKTSKEKQSKESNNKGIWMILIR